MSSRTYPDDPVQPHLYPSQNQFGNQEFKASYDDLIDDYNERPYATTTRHQTFNVDAPGMHTGEHRRNTSIPLTEHSVYTSKQPPDDTSQENLHVAYPPLPTKEVDTRGFWQKLLPESMACRLYVLTVLVETAIDLAIEGELLLRVHDVTKNNEDQITSRKMPVYLSIFALAHVFQFAMAVDAVQARNTLQFICLTVFNALFLVYAIIQIREVQEAVASSTTEPGVSTIPIHVLTTIIPIVISIAEIFYIALGWKIYHEFGWKVYKFLGADRRIKKMYANYQIYECLVKFDVFFWVGFSVQFIWLVLNSSDWEYYVTCAALPLSIVLLIEGHLAARHENKWMMATFMSGCVGAMVYFVYKLVKVLMYKDHTEFKFIWKTLTVFSVIAIILLLVTFIFSILTLQNFGRGLKESLQRKEAQHKRQWSQHPHQRTASTNLNRMSIN